ncbi:MAG: dihydrolipoamide acetyltransferase family protein [Kiritimatiellae bacterium]|jgi:pyruvate dehydrogenase E2 component (dihydrolipoamide acetyltransferase)|nr:dihydrolipoamide acetyltransferase family protein [Kiritimatiellia bacterium]
MAQIVLMPKLGQTVEESTIVKWHKAVGDSVKKGDVLFEIETDKAVLECESFYDGTLLKILVAEEETVPVQSVVAYIGEPGEKIPDAPAAPAAKPEPKKKAAAAPAPVEQKKSAPAVEVAKPAPVAAPAVSSVPSRSDSATAKKPGRLFISPRAKALVKNKVVKAENISGSGPNGRIVEKDVLAYLEQTGYNDLRIAPAAKRLAADKDIDILDVTGTGDNGRIMVRDVETTIAEQPQTMSKMRQIIASRLAQSFGHIPHFYVTTSIDMTDLLEYRKELKAKDMNLSVTTFILEAVVMSLEESPIVNSSTDGVSVRWHSNVDLGVAVSLENGLVVPVVKKAQTLTIEELQTQMKDLSEKARTGRLMPDQMSGSTFTVSNMGMFDVENFSAIINPGEGGILAVSSTLQQPVVKDGEIKIRSMMKITLSADHRTVDGAKGAEFVKAIKSKLEDVELWKSLI